MWSLGIILVNLTCGRNPWKRASIEDSTFRAYLKNPKFLSSILPLSSELDSILRRIFECDPRKRIGIPELRELVLRCPRFTKRSPMSPLTPPMEAPYGADTTFDTALDAVNPFHQYPTAPYTPVPSPPIHHVVAQPSHRTVSSNGSSPSDGGSVFSTSSSCSTTSSCSEYEEVSQVQKSAYVLPQPVGNFHGNFFLLDSVAKEMASQPFISSVQVC